MPLKDFWPFTKHSQFNFVPQKWEQSKGENCQWCKGKISSQYTISLCRCYLFCHEKCFKKNFAPNLRPNQSIKCIRCDQKVQINYFPKVVCIINTDKKYIISVSIAILLFLVMFILIMNGFFSQTLSNGVAYFILFGMFASLCGAIINSSTQIHVPQQNIVCKNTNQNQDMNKQNKQAQKPSGQQKSQIMMTEQKQNFEETVRQLNLN